MRRRGIAVFLLALAPLASPGLAQVASPSEKLVITAGKAATWLEGQTNVIELQGPIIIDMDHTRLTAQQAVVWLKPIPGEAMEQQQAEISLIGNASLHQNGITRSGDQLFVSGMVRGTIRITAGERYSRDLSTSPLYLQAAAIRPGEGGALPRTAIAQHPWAALPLATTSAPATTRATAPAPILPPPPVRFSCNNLETRAVADGTLAVVLSGDVSVFYQRPEKADFIEMQAQNVVLFTTATAKRALALSGQPKQGQLAGATVTSAYLENDVRLVYSPTTGGISQQRLEANRVFYDLRTDRAILTDAILHTTDPKTQIPVILRAETLRQLSRDQRQAEYNGEQAQFSTSALATPTYSIAADKIYLRQEELGGVEGHRDTFVADDVTLNAVGVPFLYLPAVAGSMTDDTPLRSIQITNSTYFGFGVQSNWGLFESLGEARPRDLDLSYEADYFDMRGPAGGINARYAGGFVTQDTDEPWNFNGTFRSYVVDDHGYDQFGGERTDVPANDASLDEVRGRVFWQHQHFFPDDWQVQLQGAWISDPTFMEEWYQGTNEWEDPQPHNESVYLKQQQNTNAFTFLATYQPNNFVTSADLVENQFEVEHQPDIGYHSVGDSFANDQLTFYSDNSLARLQYVRSNASLADQGYGTTLSPGIPSLGPGANGQGPNGQGLGLDPTNSAFFPNNPTYRGDFRQEVDYPLDADRVKLMPYVVGRYTPYSNSPNDGTENRVYGATGITAVTDFWKVDDSAESDLFDIHRLRHIIEPELSLFTSGSTVDRQDLYLYDEDVDAINDISAAQIALRQRWETKRGGPGDWHSVDVFDFDIAGNFFANKPPNSILNPEVIGTNGQPLYSASGFRSIYFTSLTEDSVPRDGVNADQTWRVSDTTTVLADQEYNLDNHDLATAAIGLNVTRDPRVMYYFGVRYIKPLDSNIITFSTQYTLSTKYALFFSQSYDLGQGQDVSSTYGVVRKFDRLYVTLSSSYDETSGQTVFGINVAPEGFLGFSNSQASLFAKNSQ